MWGLAPWNANPLMRRTDRTVSLVACTAVVLALALVPFAALAGALTYASAAEESAMHRANAHWINAVVIDDPHRSAASAAYADVIDSRATVEWQSPSGETRAERTKVAPDVREGDRVVVWIDDAGELVDAPASGMVNAAVGVGVAVGVLTMGGLSIAAASAAFWFVVRRERMRQWDREWRSFTECFGDK